MVSKFRLDPRSEMPLNYIQSNNGLNWTILGWLKIDKYWTKPVSVRGLAFLFVCAGLQVVYSASIWFQVTSGYVDAVLGHDRGQPCGSKAGRKYGRTTNTVVVNRPNGPECGGDATLTLGVVAIVFPVMAARETA